jgi:HEAT repeat protein
MFSNQESIDNLLKLADSWNGYERERAVKQLGLMGNLRALPMLVKRANDWVPQVRDASCKALRSFLAEANAWAFIDVLPNIYHLENCDRDDHSTLIKEVETFLLNDTNKAKVIDGCIVPNASTARCCLKLLIDHQLLQPYQIVLHCIGSRDILVRSTVAHLFNTLTDDQLKAVMESGLKDPFMPVRRETFVLCLSRFPESAISLLESFAFDRHASVREIAAKHLTEIGADIQNLYLQRLSAAPRQLSPLRSALLGLSENNCISAIDAISEYLSSAQPSLRKASLQALVTLDPQNAEQYLTAGIRDISPGVVRESARLIQKNRIKLGEPTLIDLCAADSSAVMKSCALSLNRIRSKWDRLLFLVWLANSPGSAEFMRETNIEMGRWIADYNRSFAPQTTHQTETLNRRLQALPGHAISRISSQLKPYL